VIVVVGVVVACSVYFSRQDGGTKTVAAHTARPLSGEHRAARDSIPKPIETRTLVPPAQPEPKKKEKRRPQPDAESRSAAILPADAEASFEALAASLPAQIGLAVAPLHGGSGSVEEFGDLREGHAWSSIKVPILTTLMVEDGEALDPEEEAWATSALTASDNEAAASLFGRLEERDGGLDGASRAVEATLQKAGDYDSQVATAPPPPGAVSTYGQSEWSLLGSVQFYASLADGCLLGEGGTDYVTGLMEDVIPEQRWGLGEAGFPSGWEVGMKGGWGPESEAGGAYLVRQSGFVRSEGRGIAVAMMALDESGSYPAGAADLTRIAQWLAGELQGLGPPAASC
jgi:hypothetical protein